jgi:hypothetical protein
MAVIEMKPTSRGMAHSFDAQAAFAVPIGAASPLWLAFAGAAGAGLAYWWISRWMRPANLEAWLSPPRTAPPVPPAEPAPLAVVEPMAKAVGEAAPAPEVIEAIPAPVASDHAAPEPAGQATPAEPAPKPAASPRTSSRTAPRKT